MTTLYEYPTQAGYHPKDNIVSLVPYAHLVKNYSVCHGYQYNNTESLGLPSQPYQCQLTIDFLKRGHVDFILPSSAKHTGKMLKGLSKLSK